MAVEIMSMHFILLNTNNPELPKRHKTIIFWCIRILVSVIAGGLAVAYNVDKELLAINIGASAPLLIGTLARGYSNPDSSQ